VYPFIVAKRNPDKIELKEVPRYIPDRKIERHKIRKTGEVFTDTFYLFIKHIGKISQLFFVLIFPLAVGLIFLIFSLNEFSWNYDLGMTETLQVLFGTGEYYSVYKFFGWSFILALLFSSVFYVMNLTDEDDEMLF